MTRKRVMISAGEASGDLHGANLVRAMRDQYPDIDFCGMGGKELAGAGVELLFDAKRIAVVGIAEVLSVLPDIVKAQKRLKKRMLTECPDLLILVDFPDFNFMLAKFAKKHGIPIYYYISPQVWAWRSGRVDTMRRLVDAIGVILPFEEQFFRERDVSATYVGHPLLDTVHAEMGRDMFCKTQSIDPDSILVALVPGSRKKEIRTLLPVLLQAAQLAQKETDKKMVFCLPLASTVTIQELEENGLREHGAGLSLHLITENKYDMMAACDAALVVSGTVTLEFALLDTPMVVFYKLSNITYRLGKLLVSKSVHYFSLVNLIAGEPVVPELVQEQVTPEKLSSELCRILFDTRCMRKMKDGLALVRKRMGNKGASEKSAKLALSLLDLPKKGVDIS